MIGDFYLFPHVIRYYPFLVNFSKWILFKCNPTMVSIVFIVSEFHILIYGNLLYDWHYSDVAMIF